MEKLRPSEQKGLTRGVTAYSWDNRCCDLDARLEAWVLLVKILWTEHLFFKRLVLVNSPRCLVRSLMYLLFVPKLSPAPLQCHNLASARQASLLGKLTGARFWFRLPRSGARSY